MYKKQKIMESIEDNPIITAVKDWEGIEQCKKIDSKVVFVLFGDICDIPEIVRQIKAAGKITGG